MPLESLNLSVICLVRLGIRLSINDLGARAGQSIVSQFIQKKEFINSGGCRTSPSWGREPSKGTQFCQCFPKTA